MQGTIVWIHWHLQRDFHASQRTFVCWRFLGSRPASAPGLVLSPSLSLFHRYFGGTLRRRNCLIWYRCVDSLWYEEGGVEGVCEGVCITFFPYTHTIAHRKIVQSYLWVSSNWAQLLWEWWPSSARSCLNRPVPPPPPPLLV